MKINSVLLEAPTVFTGTHVFNLLSMDGHELSFYGSIIKSPTAKLIFIKGTLILRSGASGLSNNYSFPIANLTNQVGVTEDKIPYSQEYCVGECEFRKYVSVEHYELNTSPYLNGYYGVCYIGSNKGLYCERLYNIIDGSHGAWSWESIGEGNPVMINIIIPYTD